MRRFAVLDGRVCRLGYGWPSVRTDIRNAGGTVLDQEVVTDGNLVSSRRADDLPAFCRAIVAHFAGAGAHIPS